MGNPVIHTQLHNLGIYHDQPYLFRGGFVKDTHNQCIDTYGFTGACGACNQQMGHLGNIGNDRLSCNIFSRRKCQLGFARGKSLGLYQFTKHNCTVCGIGDFDSDGGFAGNGCLNTDIRCCQVQFDIIGQADNFADFNALFRLQLITRNGRTAAHIGHCHIDPEIVQCLLQFFGCAAKMRVRITFSAGSLFQQ